MDNPLQNMKLLMEFQKSKVGYASAKHVLQKKGKHAR